MPVPEMCRDGAAADRWPGEVASRGPTGSATCYRVRGTTHGPACPKSDNTGMNFLKILVPVMGVVMVAAAWRGYGWAGVAVVVGGIVMWVLLHFTRMMQVLKRAANNPVGHVGSAVMLNAKLKPGMTLLHVVAMTRALGEQRSPKDEQPEVFRWTDAGQSHVTCEFSNGKLVKWEMHRPQPPEEAAQEAAPPAADPAP